MSGNYLIYDGDCPFCSRFVAYARLREAAGEVRLIDAREKTPEVEAAIRDGFNLDEGMLLSLDGQLYHGADCLNALALMSSRSTWFNRVNHFLFRNPRLAAIAYPVLRAGRNAALMLLGRKRLGY